jgi:hypothetical protein
MWKMPEKILHGDCDERLEEPRRALGHGTFLKKSSARDAMLCE